LKHWPTTLAEIQVFGSMMEARHTSVVRRGQAVRRYTRRIGTGMEMVPYHLELSDVFILAIDQFNDLRARVQHKVNFLTVE
jgi:hypothetical protein